MRPYIIAIAAGIAGGVAIGVASTWAFLRIQIWRQMRESSGGGLGAASVGLGWMSLAGAVGFLLVFFWVLRHSR